MIYFVGAGPGAEDLITVRGQALLTWADVVIYAGTLVNPALLSLCATECERLDSATMTLDEVVCAMAQRDNENRLIVRLHADDPSTCGAIRAQIDAMRALNLPFRIVPGVGSFCAAMAALEAQPAQPSASQTAALSHAGGRASASGRASIRSLAAHNAPMALSLSAGMLENLRDELIAGGYAADTPAAVVYKASWPDQKVVRGTIDRLPQIGQDISKAALVLVGNFLGGDCAPPKHRDPGFPHGCQGARA